jgi:hypothetical protein
LSSAATFFRELSVLRVRIDLLLNPKEADHHNLMVRIDEMTTLFASPLTQSSLQEYAETEQDMLDRAKVVLKEEWDRARNAK